MTSTTTSRTPARAWAAALTLLLATIVAPRTARAQAPPTPIIDFPNSCVAMPRFEWDASNVAGADGVTWEFRHAPAENPGLDVASADLVDSRDRPLARRVTRDLRAWGPVLDGGRWFFRVHATSGGNPVGDWSEPAIFDRTASPDGQFTATAAGSGTIQLSWNLTGDLAACADRVRLEIRKDDPNGSPVRTSTETGTSGSRTIDLSGEGGGTFYVRLAARFGGNAPENAVGAVGQDVPVDLEASTYALRVQVLDQAATDCLGTETYRPGTSVTVESGSFSDQGTTNDNGRVSFQVPPGTYQVTATSPAPCATPVTQTVSVTGNVRTTLSVPNCQADVADLALASLSSPSPPSASSPYPFTGTIRNLGPGAPSGPFQVNLLRRATDAVGPPSRIGSKDFGPLCGTETWEVRDGTAQQGKSYVYIMEVRSSAADPNAGNNQIQRTVSFPVEAVAVQPAPSNPPPARAAPVNPVSPVSRRPPVARPAVPTTLGGVSLNGFALDGGAESAGLNEDVALDATYAGQPTEYRAGLCGADFERAAWRAYRGRPAPTMRFSTDGTKTVCFQLRSRAGASTIRNDDIRIRPANELHVDAVAVRAVQPDVRMTSFRLREGRRYALRNAPVTMNATAQNDPAYYRFAPRGTRCDLDGVGWRPWSAGDAPATSFSTTGTKRICFQLARDNGLGRSEIREDAIEVLDPTVESSMLGHPNVTVIPFAPLPPPRLPRFGSCPSGTRAIGLVVRADVYVSAVGLKCANLGSGGVHGVTSETPLIGGDQGTVREVVCPNGRAMVGVRIRYGEVVDRIQVRCSPWTARDGAQGTASTTTGAGGTGGTDTASYTCPRPYSVVTISPIIHDLFGNDRLAAIRLVCQVPTDL